MTLDLAIANHDKSKGITMFATTTRSSPFKRPSGNLTTSALNAVDAALTELEQIENTIDAHMSAWLDVGDAFDVIRTNGLYRVAGYKRFSDYCNTRWGMSESAVLEYVNGCKVYRTLEANGIKPLETRSTLKALFQFDDEDRVQLYLKAKEIHNSSRKKVKLAIPRSLMLKVTGDFLGVKPKPKTHKSIRVPIQTVELLEPAAKRAGLDLGTFIDKLVSKVLDE
jgi:hypothetical protein